jgi:outer membrane protein
MTKHAFRRVLIASALQGAFAFPVVAQTARDTAAVVTLPEARRLAAGVDPVSVGARSRASTASWERRAAWANFLTPSVTATTSYIHFSEPFFNFGTLALSPNATSAELRASYTFLGGGKLAELKRSGASVRLAEAGETAALFRTALATDAAYFGALADRELSRVANDRLRRAVEQLGVARSRVLAGEAIAPDSLRLLLEVNRARLEVVRRDSALVVSRLRLGRQIGRDGPVDAAPVDSMAPATLPFTLEEAVTEFSARGPELLAARAAESHAEALLGAERQQYLPEVTLGATTGAYDAHFFPEAAKRSQLVLTVTLPIWNAGRREVAVARAREQRDVARAERDDRERGAGEVMAAAYHGHQTARAGVALALTGVAVASENYRVQSSRYREGATTILDLLEAQVALSEAEATLVQARYAARLALARIEALLGRRIFEPLRDN